jgi:hypothetical protein
MVNPTLDKFVMMETTIITMVVQKTASGKMIIPAHKRLLQHHLTARKYLLIVEMANQMQMRSVMMEMTKVMMVAQKNASENMVIPAQKRLLQHHLTARKYLLIVEMANQMQMRSVMMEMTKVMMVAQKNASENMVIPAHKLLK